MLPIIKEIKQKLRTARGFTMVELMVVLLILGILAALAGTGLIAYVRLARFEHNESGARTVFQTAQIALTRKDTSGDMDTFLTELREVGTLGDHFSADGLSEQFGDGAAEKANAFNSQIYALYYDKANPDSDASKMVRGLLDPYVYDESLFNASIVVEVDSLTGQVYSAFYDTASDKLRFASDEGADGAMLIDDRSYGHRRGDSLVGYYSAEDTVNVVALSQTRLKVKNPQLINNETLTLNWSGNSKNGDIDTIYDAEFYDATTNEPLFKLEIEWSRVLADPTHNNAQIKVYRPNAEGNGWSETYQDYTFPLSYSKGRFILTLDAMCDANLLRAAENDGADLRSTKTTLFSITRLTDHVPKDVYVTMKARPNANFQDLYTESKPQQSNTENTLFAAGSKASGGTLKYFRHLYNLRWVNSGEYTFTGKNTALDWTDGGVTVYCSPEKKDAEPVAKVPSRTGEIVAWPTIPAIGKDVTLNGSTGGSGQVVISNLQLRGSSIAAVERKYAGEAAYKARDHYVGLVGENNGTLKNITLRDPDVQINAEVRSAGEQNADTAMAMDANGTQYLQALADTDPDYRTEIWSVGALAGVDTGSLTNCTIDRSSRRGAEAKVTAVLTFSSKTTGVNRVDGTSYKDEPHGIGGLVGFAMPKTGAKLTGLTLDQNVTVAGIFQDKDAAKNSGADTGTSADTAEKARYNAIANENESQTLWRAVGVGGVAGVLDATNLTGTRNAENLKDITNKSTVVGNAFVGGITGNLYSTTTENDSDANTLTGLANQGTVLAGANYQGSTAGQSRVLGQFFGGIAGYARSLVLDECHSATRSGLSETTLTNLVQAGYNADGTLNENSPLKGDFVGGLVGFGRDVQMTNCYTESGYVLGRSFVGGFVGGFVGSNLYTSGGTNNSYVFGNRYVGGIVSVNGLNSTIENMTNKGLVAGLGANGAYVGGIAGVNDAAWGKQDSAALAKNETAKLVDSVNSMSTVEVTDKNKIALLQQLSQTGDGTPRYADFVGGVAGCNGTHGQISWQANSDKGAVLGAVLYGGSFVGGVAGYNDATATITNSQATILSVTGTIVATGDCVGGVIGLNGAASLPTVQVSTNRIEGVHFVGGVIGANLPANEFKFVNAGGAAANAATIGTGRIVADGVAGGMIGYNRVVNADTLKSALQNKNGTIAADLQTLLPKFSSGNALDEPALNPSGSAITLTSLSNQFNIYANAYVGGIIGYNAADTTLTLENASNGNQSQAQSYGGLALSPRADAANGGAYRLDSGVSLGELDPDHNGYFAGGIIGCTTAKTTLHNCTNYGGVQHPVAAGGLTGVNNGTITNGRMVNSMGSQQEGYRYLGGIAGINNGTITNSAPAESSSIRGGLDIGGVAGYNSKSGVITLENASGNVYGITATGGVAGYNLGTVTARSVTVKVSGTTQTGGVAGLNAASGTIGQDPRTPSSISITVQNGTTVSSTTQGGGVAGRNEGLIQNATNRAGSIQVVNQYAGGIAGSNSGRIYSCMHAASGNRVLYTGGGFAGGIAGCNEVGGKLENVTMNGSVTAANGEAGGVTAHNYGSITMSRVYGSDIRGTSDAIGGITACNEAGAVISDANLFNMANFGGDVRLYGPATRVGGLVGYSAGSLSKGNVRANSLSLANLTAGDSTVTAGGALGENTGTAENVTVSTNLQDSMAKYLNLGGVAGSSSGTLSKCSYTGAIGKDNGFTTVGSTVGGIVGSNDVVYNTDGTAAATGKVKDCKVGYIELKVQGASNVGASQDAATKMNSAAHIGGIVGRNRGEITGSTVGTKDKTGSIITARSGFVGGVAGSNSGSISTSGGLDTQPLVKQINAWLDVPYKDETTTDENGNKVTAQVVDTDKQNANLNQMVRVLTGKASGDAETKLQTDFKAMQGFDTLTYGDKNYNTVYTNRSVNQLLVSLRGSTSHGNGLADGYLGGITGFNDVTGQITNSASGQWFVYADNINQSWGAVGGVIGQNESNADSTSGLVNFAAVRRFVRGTRGTADDNSNANNDRYATTKGDNAADNYVGGVIGTQENRTGDRWTLEKCINVGTVFNSRSNNAGGVLAYWLSYGGTLTNCYNFGEITTNANNGESSGTVGGVAGYFNNPVAGTAANLYRCSNYGSVKKMTNGANDVGGVFGKVQLANDHNSDAMTINVIECVNGSNVELQAQSMSVGIFCYIGPWAAIPNVEVNIDRCRNYCTEMWGPIRSAGIWGNRGNGSTSNKKTTITNCFALYKSTNNTGRSWFPIAYRHTANEKLTGSNNYYMQLDKSFAGYSGIKGLQEGLGRTNVTGGWTQGTNESEEGGGATTDVKAHRLYAGVDSGANAAQDGDNFYHFFAMLPKISNDGRPVVSMQAVKKSSSYITTLPGQNFSEASSVRYIFAKDAKDLSKYPVPEEWNVGYVGKILLLFDDVNGDNKTSKEDITDEVLQRYYSNILDNSTPDAPTGLKIERSDATGSGNESIYGRYNVTWNAPTTGSPAIYYHITVYETDENGDRIGNISLLEADAYDTRFTFESKAEWKGRYFKVSVAGVNSKGTGTAAASGRQQFVRALPTPELEVRLMPTPEEGGHVQFSQKLVLTNADEYDKLMQDSGLADWSVTVKVGGDNGDTYRFSNGNTTPKRISERLGSSQRMTAEATSSDQRWMRSGQYDETVYMPVSWVVVPGDNTWGNSNSGLAEGRLAAKNVEITGATIDDLTVTVTLNFTASVSGTQPTYRVMLMGRYLGDEAVTLNGENVYLKGQYITLAARQNVMPNSNTTFTFNNLPDDTLTNYDNWTVVAVPVTSGLGDVVTRWDAADAEALAKLQASTPARPASWYGGLEIVRESNGYSFANLTPLYFVSKNLTDYSNWAGYATNQVIFEQNNITVAQAPKLTGVPADGDLYLNYDVDKLANDNQLAYTFTWTQPGEAAASGGNTKYKLTLYGVTETRDENGNVISTAEETITLPDDANSKVQYKDGTYSYTLYIDTDLAGGSNSWRFDKVRLRVTRDTTGTTQGIGAADTAVYTVLRRLQQVGEPGQVFPVDTSNAEQTRYQISWPAVSDERVDHYELWAQVQTTNAAGTTLGEAFKLHPADGDSTTLIKDTQTIVDLEAYQGETLVFYVVACPADGDTTVLRSPNGEVSDPQTIIQRTEAPAISKVDFTWTGKAVNDALPLMNAFCNDLTIRMTVDKADAASYFFTGYLFDDEANYIDACAKAKIWMDDPTKENLDALNAALREDKATLMIPEASKTVGSETQVSGDGTTVSYTVTPNANAFTMQPADANRYLLPALRAMVANSETAATSSSWKFYVPDDDAGAAGALHLPKIQLDKPEKDGVLSVTSVESTVEGKLYGTEGEAWKPDSAEITIHQYAVQWPAVNEYTDTDGTTRNFAEKYRFHVTPAADMPADDPNEEGYDIRFTVAPADVVTENDDGTQTITTHRGDILKVEKLPFGLEENDPANWLDITKAARNIANEGTEDEYVWYDLSIVQVTRTVTNDDGTTSEVTELVSQPITLTGHHAIDNDNPSYRIKTVPALRQAEMTDYSLGYRLTLPDMTQRADGDNDETRALEKYTEKVTIWAVGNGEKTVDSDRLEVSLRTEGQAMTEDAARPVFAMAEADPRPAQSTGRAGETDPTPPANDPGAADTPVTPENAAPAA